MEYIFESFEKMKGIEYTEGETLNEIVAEITERKYNSDVWRSEKRMIKSEGCRRTKSQIVCSERTVHGI